VAGLTAVDGALVLTSDLRVWDSGAKSCWMPRSLWWPTK
jgi:hypothetical protein